MRLNRGISIMIPRYTRPEMGAIWTDENKFRIWLQIEVLACEAMNKLGQVPAADLRNIQHAREVQRQGNRPDRGQGQPRRHRVPDQRREIRRAVLPLHPQGADQFRHSRHVALGADGAGGRPADRGREGRPQGRGGEGEEVQVHADDGPHARRSTPSRSRSA